MPGKVKKSDTVAKPTVAAANRAINGHPARCMGMNKVFNAGPAFQVLPGGILAHRAKKGMIRTKQYQFVLGRAKTWPGKIKSGSLIWSLLASKMVQ